MNQEESEKVAYLKEKTKF